MANKKQTKAVTAKPSYTVGCLDCKVDGGYIENVDDYRAKGWQIINSAHLDKPKQKYDVLVTTWTQLNRKRLEAVKCRAVVIRDNDEPDNVCHPAELAQMGIPFYLIDNWGISTRVAWNWQQIADHKPNARKITIIANTPSHDAMTQIWREKLMLDVSYPNVPKTAKLPQLITRLGETDVLIVHLGKLDFPRYWLDPLFKSLKKSALFISTTRGALYSANEINHQLQNRGLIAVLDWAWQEEAIEPHANLHLTHHASYKSEQARNELTQVTTASILKAVENLSLADAKK